MKRIFIVEDHELVLESYATLIDMQDGVEVAGSAATAEEALAALPQAAPDLVLADISLPGMSGIDLLRRLRQEGPSPPVLIITGHDDEHYERDAHAAGACGFVLKSSGPQALLTALRESLQQAQ